MKRTWLCYITDEGFLTPSLASAASIRRWVSADDAPIVVIAIGCADVAREIVGRERLEGVTVVSLEENLDAAMQDYSPVGHQSISAAGRFYLHRYMPDECDYVVYVDGDTFAFDDPTPFFQFRPPEGNMVAAPCIFTLRRFTVGRKGREMARHARELGLGPRDVYFNAGILAASKKTWAELGPAGLEYIQANPDRCWIMDQCALNAAAAGRTTIMSPRWNFQTPYLIRRPQLSFGPGIAHFTGSHKIWHGDGGPWAEVYDQYMPVFERFTHPGAQTAKMIGQPQEAAAPNAHSWLRRARWKNRFGRVAKEFALT